MIYGRPGEIGSPKLHGPVKKAKNVGIAFNKIDRLRQENVFNWLFTNASNVDFVIFVPFCGNFVLSVRYMHE